jgi:hypothetical protein
MADRADAALELEEHLGKRPATRLLPYLHWLDAAARRRLFERLAGHRLRNIDALALEALLSRPDQDLRDGILDVLERQSDREALASLARLLEGALHARRLAGLELARRLMGQRRLVQRCRKLLEAHAVNRRLRSDEAQQIASLLRSKRTQTKA